ncbi:hypothetical protein PybrP1_008628, partial [[Pythium] brassicae (nom. inval.)]
MATGASHAHVAVLAQVLAIETPEEERDRQSVELSCASVEEDGSAESSSTLAHVVLGRSDVDKLPIFSFLARFHDRFLHHNFVCALLNDLFGVQSRGGCQCAGPYAARLLGIELDDLGRFKDAL